MVDRHASSKATWHTSLIQFHELSWHSSGAQTSCRTFAHVGATLGWGGGVKTGGELFLVLLCFGLHGQSALYPAWRGGGEARGEGKKSSVMYGVGCTPTSQNHWLLLWSSCALVVNPAAFLIPGMGRGSRVQWVGRMESCSEGSVIGWVDIGTGTKLWAVLIHIEKIFSYCF